ncbi:sensor histidine kinase [Pseudonocardia acaciae]|uniref:sensor histidine kinase n=1 Tax=Pseudonocardia acaciae TaxID=551276 RepID=UPI0009FF7782|nr:sensor histidine kinase [Pseudonocardia acaciae]
MNASDPSARRFGTLVNAGLGLAFAVVLAGTAFQVANQGRHWVLGVCAGIVVCGAALLRERHRVWAAAVGLVAGGVAGLVARFADLPREPGLAATLALLVLAGSSVRAAPAPLAALVAAGVVVLPAGWLTPASSGTSYAQLEAGIVAWCVALGVGLWLRFIDQRHREATETVRREERLTLARELHDVVAHSITGVILQAQAGRILARKRPEALGDTLTDIETAGTDALAAMRRVVGVLRTEEHHTPVAPGAEQLTELVRRFDGHGPAVRLNLPAEHPTLPPEVATTVYRIVQESLTNIARHAPHAQAATVEVTHDPHTLTVEVTDDAPPGPRAHHHRGGFGLVGMRERVEALGGTLHAGPQPDAGWSVRATLPVPPGHPR